MTRDRKAALFLMTELDLLLSNGDYAGADEVLRGLMVQGAALYLGLAGAVSALPGKAHLLAYDELVAWLTEGYLAQGETTESLKTLLEGL